MMIKYSWNVNRHLIINYLSNDKWLYKYNQTRTLRDDRKLFVIAVTSGVASN